MIERKTCAACVGRGCEACLGTGKLKRDRASSDLWVPDVDVFAETKLMVQENFAWSAKRLPTRPADTKYSDELPDDPPPRRYGHDPLDPAGLWNPPT